MSLSHRATPLVRRLRDRTTPPFRRLRQQLSAPATRLRHRAAPPLRRLGARARAPLPRLRERLVPPLRRASERVAVPLRWLGGRVGPPARAVWGAVHHRAAPLLRRLRKRWEPAWVRMWEQVWEGLRPIDPYRSVKAALGALVVVSVVITTLLALFAVYSATELRVITVFSIIASLLITQFVAQSLTYPLDEMTDAAKAMAHGDYSRRVRVSRRDEFGELAENFNRMAADLESVDQHRKELVANVSHELRTPIAALRAVLENVVDGVSDPDPENMRTALQQTERLGRLVDHLLDLSRLDSGVVPLHARRFEVWPYLAGVLKESNMSKGSGHARTDVHLHLDVSPPELTAYADPERLHQVVANLIDNAVKHSPAHGRVTVRARRGETEDRRESLEVEVLDEGPGIPESQRHRVFERFNRMKETGPAGAGGSGGAGDPVGSAGGGGGQGVGDGGTGLGLAIARWAVDLHGGRIRVAESPKGCRIHVTLPGLANEQN